MTTQKNDDLASTTMQWDEEYDMVILGAGAAGLTATQTSTIEGKHTLLIEKSDQIGGTTAYS